jgi:hypothetical protein
MTSAFMNGKQTYVHRIQRCHNPSGASRKPLHVQFKEALKSAFERGAASRPANAPEEATCKCGNTYAAYADRTACYLCTKWNEMPSEHQFLDVKECCVCGSVFKPSSKADNYCKKISCRIKWNEEFTKKKQKKANE